MTNHDQHAFALYMTRRTGRTCESSWCHKACLRQRDVRGVVRLSLTCVTLMPEAALIQADRRCLLEGSLLYTQAVLRQQGKLLQYTSSPKSFWTSIRL